MPLAGQGLLGPLVVAVLQLDRVRQGTPFPTSSPHSLSPWALTPSWAFQAGLPSTVVVLETLLRWGTNLPRAGWPCASCVSCTGHNSKFPVSRSQHRPGSLGTGVFLKVLSFTWRMSFGLVWSAFFFLFPVCHQTCRAHVRLQITCCVVQEQQFGVRLNGKKLFYWHPFMK